MSVLTSFDLWSNIGLTKGILVILAEEALQVLRCPNGLRRVILDVLVALWKENNFLNFSGSNMQIEGGQNTVSTLVMVEPRIGDVGAG